MRSGVGPAWTEERPGNKKKWKLRRDGKKRSKKGGELKNLTVYNLLAFCGEYKAFPHSTAWRKVSSTDPVVRCARLVASALSPPSPPLIQSGQQTIPNYTSSPAKMLAASFGFLPRTSSARRVQDP